VNILILNVHSALNLGDEAIMRVTLESLRQAFPRANITVAANDPESWFQYHDAVFVGSLTRWIIHCREEHWYANIFAVPVYLILLIVAIVGYRLLKIKLLFGSAEQQRLMSAYYDADLVLSCGGGNFYAHRLISPFFIWAVFSLGVALGLSKHVIMLPQSIGPIAGQFQRILARQVFNRVKLIMHREQLSFDFVARDLKVKTPGILIPDMAFGLPPIILSRSRDNAVPLQIGVTVTDRIAQRDAVCQKVYEDTLEIVLVKLNQTRDIHIHIFVQCYGPSLVHDDRLAAQRLYERLRRYTDRVNLWVVFSSALALRIAYAQMDCMIGTRMHTAIFAASSGVPVVLISYQPKAIGVMRMLEVSEYTSDIETLTPEQLYDLVSRALQNREELRAHLLARYDELRGQLDDWTRFLEI